MSMRNPFMTKNAIAPAVNPWAAMEENLIRLPTIETRVTHVAGQT